MDRHMKVMMAQVKNALKKPSELFIPFPDDMNLDRWVVLICGLEDAHEFGEYFVEFTAGPDFPDKAPKDYTVLTENGVFDLGGKICISLGEFHDKDKGRTDTWRPALGMPGFAANIANVFICYKMLGHGIRIKDYPTDPVLQKEYDRNVARLAKQSYGFNSKHNKHLFDRLENFIKHNPKHPAVINIIAKRKKLNGENTSKVETKVETTVGTDVKAKVELKAETNTKSLPSTLESIPMQPSKPMSRPDIVEKTEKGPDTAAQSVCATKKDTDEKKPESPAPKAEPAKMEETLYDILAEYM